MLIATSAFTETMMLRVCKVYNPLLQLSALNRGAAEVGVNGSDRISSARFCRTHFSFGYNNCSFGDCI